MFFFLCNRVPVKKIPWMAYLQLMDFNENRRHLGVIRFFKLFTHCVRHIPTSSYGTDVMQSFLF
jgi:hypothetical protein